MASILSWPQCVNLLSTGICTSPALLAGDAVFLCNPLGTAIFQEVAPGILKDIIFKKNTARNLCEPMDTCLINIDVDTWANYELATWKPRTT